MLGSSEPRRRKKDPDRDRDSPKTKDKDRERHKSSKTSRSSRKTSSAGSKDEDKHRERDRDRPPREEVTTPSSHSSRSSKKMALVPEMNRRGSLGESNGSRVSLPYPSFSKDHSKESVFSKESLVERKQSPFTPEPTDLGQGSPEKRKEDVRRHSSPNQGAAPPSPPLTATTAADLRKQASANSMRKKVDGLQKEMERGRQSVESGTRMTAETRSHGARSSVREVGLGVDGTDLTSTTSPPSTIRQPEKSARLATPNARPESPAKSRSPSSRLQVPSTVRGASDVTQSTGSEATSTGTARPKSRLQPTASPTESENSPASIVDSSPRTPTQHSVLPSVLSSHSQVLHSQKERPAVEILIDDPQSRSQSVDPIYSDSPLTPPPPPPPPTVIDAPRVDYLLQHGGLNHTIPRSLLAAIDNTPVMAYSQYASPRVAGPQAHDVREIFSPLQKLLDDYTNVMNRNGSLAVATGYRSVARRLLDRLEAVFARNISSEHCTCIMCINKTVDEDDGVAAGVNWGEVLELVSGRCDLPNWPPFDSRPVDGLGISELEAPCQRLDVDVPDEYREHFQQQSRKTKLAVQSWLSNQQDTAPEEADDETLTFAMLTRLEPDKRSLYYALLYGLNTLPGPRFQPAPTDTVPESITKAALALQRLYRLYAPPRAQLVVMYLLRNPAMHSVLATLAAVNKSEWDILISGRFDGFLWSGAENTSPFGNVGSPAPMGPSRGPSRGPDAGDMGIFDERLFSRGPTGSVPPFTPSGSYFPFSPGGGSRPSSRFGTRQNAPVPVQLDEDTEIAVLAEIEREIYLGMEALEDAFEHLHNSAEVVRRRLRERGAALAMVAQARRGYASGGIEVRTDTPASFRPDLDAETLDELRSEILPDDSASNVSHARRRRPGRRERRTPAPVEEEEEPIVVVESHRRKGSGAHKKTGYAR